MELVNIWWRVQITKLYVIFSFLLLFFGPDAVFIALIILCGTQHCYFKYPVINNMVCISYW